jgi:hypothetical protein
VDIESDIKNNKDELEKQLHSEGSSSECIHLIKMIQALKNIL